MKRFPYAANHEVRISIVEIRPSDNGAKKLSYVRRRGRGGPCTTDKWQLMHLKSSADHIVLIWEKASRRLRTILNPVMQAYANKKP